MFHPPVQLNEWPSADHRTRMVFITRDVGQGVIEPMFENFVFGGATPDGTAPA